MRQKFTRDTLFLETLRMTFVVAQNYECGIVLDFQDVQQGDVIEAFIEVEEAATL